MSTSKGKAVKLHLKFFILCPVIGILPDFQLWRLRRVFRQGFLVGCWGGGRSSYPDVHNWKSLKYKDVIP